MEKPLIQIVIVKAEKGYDLILFDKDQVVDRLNFEQWWEMFGALICNVQLLEVPHA